MKWKACMIILLLMNAEMWGQQNRVKLGFIGFPSQSGFGIGNIGYERLDRSKKRSWQLLYSMSGGSAAVDLETYKRKWITVERIVYFNTRNKKLDYFYTLFLETGKRTSEPGYIAVYDTSRYDGLKAFELSPGVAGGLRFALSKRLGLETGGGPKFIWLNGEEQYYNRRDDIHFSKDYRKTKLGFRFMFSFSWQF
ncbi:MAG TPA: hypothetical protein VMZ03_07545 [Chitinophagaceae bacterium]|nr:hypothetical protein [Chitinophagaceae bacterium]